MNFYKVLPISFRKNSGRITVASLALFLAAALLAAGYFYFLAPLRGSGVSPRA